MTNEVNPLVYILILNYCSVNDTIECIRSVRKLKYSNFRLLVIDNHSPDGSGEVLRQTISQKEFIQNTVNVGYAGGNNGGIRIALENGASYVFVVNPDVRLREDSICSYVEELERDESIGALNPVQLEENGVTVDDSFSRAVLSSARNRCGSVLEVNTLFGAALMLPTRTIKRVGGFDPLFFAYGEEEDLCRRIRQRGLKLVVTEKAPVIHKRTKENAPVSDFVLFLRLKGAYLYNLKNPALGFRFAIRHTCHDLVLDLQRRRPSIYPFNKYPIRTYHVIKSAIWLSINLLAIRRHRKLDNENCPYLD